MRGVAPSEPHMLMHEQRPVEAASGSGGGVATFAVPPLDRSCVKAVQLYQNLSDLPGDGAELWRRARELVSLDVPATQSDDAMLRRRLVEFDLFLCGALGEWWWSKPPALSALSVGAYAVGIVLASGERIAGGGEVAR